MSIMQPDIVPTRDDSVVPLIVMDRLVGHLDSLGLGSGELKVTRIGGGHSFATFMIEREGLRGILRRPPRPPWSQGAHDVAREVRVLEGMARSGVRAPRVLAFCTDLDVLGAPFAVQECVDGVVVGTQLPRALDNAAGRRGVASELVDALADLHSVDAESVGLGDLGKRTVHHRDRLDRLMRTWSEREVRSLPAVEKVKDWLTETAPESPRVTLIHGDYRVGNVLFSEAAPAELTAILDWETTSLGDPLTDLGYLLATYPDGDDTSGVLVSFSAALAGPDALSRLDLAMRYQERTGANLERLDWYVAYANWRTAVILEGLYARHVNGIDSSEFLAGLEHGVPELVGRAMRVVDGKGAWKESTV
jgi:aminoglycoside phosphotransferase (APT) family kinase protein